METIIICGMLSFICVLLVLINRNIVESKQLFMEISKVNMKAIGTNFEITQTILDEIRCSNGKGGLMDDEMDRAIKQNFRKTTNKLKGTQR